MENDTERKTYLDGVVEVRWQKQHRTDLLLFFYYNYNYYLVGGKHVGPQTSTLRTGEESNDVKNKVNFKAIKCKNNYLPCVKLLGTFVVLL